MEEMATKITVSATVNAPVAKVWDFWTDPKHITQWNSPSPDWYTPKAENDLRVGGRFNSRMEARDGSAGFDFGGTYNDVEPKKCITYTMDDGRMAVNEFAAHHGATHVKITFDAESENPVEVQRGGWQGILDSFKYYAEAQV